ncbi:putative disease resistance protein At3g14460 isoform X1 [Malus domestica]|uniref:putative disease resistance protein At3g14460 isoform X1 n=1 Tax=Malus domestica TaxID=3750 RepID=UPI003975E7A7
MVQVGAAGSQIFRNLLGLCSQMQEFEVVAGPNAHPHRPSTFVDTKSSISGVTCTRGSPPNLQTFWIENCERMRPSVEWGLQELASLREFRIQGNKDLLETLLREQLLPATLHTLWISILSNLKSLDGKGLEHLTSLQQLRISSCESLEFLPKESLQFAGISFLSEHLGFSEEEVSEQEGKRLENISRISCIKIDDEITI